MDLQPIGCNSCPWMSLVCTTVGAQPLCRDESRLSEDGHLILPQRWTVLHVRGVDPSLLHFTSYQTAGFCTAPNLDVALSSRVVSTTTRCGRTDGVARGFAVNLVDSKGAELYPVPARDGLPYPSSTTQRTLPSASISVASWGPPHSHSGCAAMSFFIPHLVQPWSPPQLFGAACFKVEHVHSVCVRRQALPSFGYEF